jgi:hypothetical protein
MIDEASEIDVKRCLDDFVKAQTVESLSREKELEGQELVNFEIEDTDFHSIKVQLRAVGLIARSTRNRSVKDTSTYWALTPYGDSVMTNLRAIRRMPSS